MRTLIVIPGLIMLVMSLATGYLFTKEILKAERMERIDGATRNVLVHILDAETGQRGFIITGNDGYLVPYEAGTTDVREALSDLQIVTFDTEQSQHVDQVKDLLQLKLDELARTIDLRRESGLPAAIAEVDTHLGRNYMDRIRQTLDTIQIYALEKYKESRNLATVLARISFFSMVATFGCCVLLVARIK